MPHLHMEYTANLPQLDADKALLRFNHALVASGQFAEYDIKSRARKVETFRVGTGLGERGFVHVKLSLLSGRSPEIKKQLSQSLLAVLQELCEWPAGVELQLAVEILDIDRESYGKLSIGH
ncbi:MULTISPECIES: 5-carboxymethyl-2-hydroxymuconate Delta-isomerase [Pseudomonas]|uniref:5-carboxymethyl-2-hydroxymuconate isomerase n=1 Tax=Pseudomonas chlororaphis TaxID=587753 RepID=A0AAQ2YFH2_9PSED|nr:MULTISPECIES: 5-carboxymethyl-2-hydroxymuconate Delta-isomerase [Pseudomonas]AVO57763.1 5-carboxymethyl-2-hydroxymuconate isomerase [Pseudomonas chlororaphis subsp. piscium]AZC29469.1 putative 5-carboxymethyl-2-hydroxymuconate delta isomerase [Pseudomonas chlororaphis subsp. piscium]AZC35943.1 putative 5-carboxymethyl-2-hydroxymuconate delta isomerase [Pseudomonas chlororaphis subsp. piscium]AZC42488.1 putative 5-carboxymethyl-2-hydroxymuconate delta isomerase [Pseudomonas chlororaphis subsp